MQKIIDNIIEKINGENKTFFTKKEILTLISEVTKDIRYPSIESNGHFLNPDNNTIQIKDNTTKLPKKEFMLLYYLISNKNKIIRRDILIRDIWGTEIIVDERTLDVHIRRLRQLTGNEYIQTRKCFGYGWFEK